MGGCTNCRAKSGCDDRKGSMFASIEDALVRLYPSRTWGAPDDVTRFEAGVCEHDGQALAEELALELDASTLYVRGGDDEYCDYIYVLCLGREPSLVQIRDAGVPVPHEIAAPGDASAPPVAEQYLRVALSHMAPFAGVQQVAIEGAVIEGDLVITESPRSGVFDPPLLPRFQRLVAILPAYDIVNLDFGDISAPPSGFAHGGYAALYGGAPHTANFLFYPQPSTMRSTTIVDAGVKGDA